MEHLHADDDSSQHQLVQKLLEELSVREVNVKDSIQCELYLEQLKVLKLYSQGHLLYSERIVSLFRNIINNASFLTNLDFFNEALDHALPLVLLCDREEGGVHKTLLEECRRFVRYLSSLKLTQSVALVRTAELTGKLIGALLRKDIERGQATLAETFISELGSLLPFEPATSDTCTNGTHLLCPTVVPLYGTLAVQCQDDTLTELCMNALISQFEKGAYGSRTCLFFDQFNLLASGTSISCFNKSLDIYTRIYLDYEKDEFLAGEISKGFLGLISNCGVEQQKLEVIAVSLLKIFVNKGLSILGEGSMREPPKVLEFLLAPISLSFEHLGRRIESIAQASVIEIFQEFWFVLVYFGYQPKLRWSDGWKNHVAIVALSTPVLIKEYPTGDKITQLSQTLLAKNVNPQLKAHLITFMPNCVQLASTLSIGQCLWLLSFYQSEFFKFAMGHFDDHFNYLTSETIQQLSLYPFVEDISITLVQQWIHQNAKNRPDHLLLLALLTMHHLGSPLERVHHTALTVLTYIVEHDSIVLSEESFWNTLLSTTFRNVHENSMVSLEALCEHPEWIQDPQQCQKCVGEVREFIERSASKAYVEYPLNMHIFAERFLNSERDVNFRNIVCTLFSNNRPSSLILKALNTACRDGTQKSDELEIGEFSRKEAARLLMLMCSGEETLIGRLLQKLAVRMASEYAEFVPVTPPEKQKIDSTPSEITPQAKASDTLEFFLIIAQFLFSQLKACSKGSFTLLSHLTLFLSKVYHLHANLRPLYLLPIFGKLGLEALQAQQKFRVWESEQQRMSIYAYAMLGFFYEQRSVYEFYEDDVLEEYLAVLTDLRGLLEQNSTQFRLTSSSSYNPSTTSLMSQASRKGRTLVDGSESRTLKTNSLMLSFTKHEVQKVQVMLGYRVEEMFVANRGQYEAACEIKLVLGLRFHERFLAHEPFRLGASYFQEPRCTGLLASSDLLDALLENTEGDLSSLTKVLMLSSSLSPVGALTAFRKFPQSPGWLNFAMRSLESYAPQTLFFYTPQLVQTLRHDTLGFINSTILHVASVSTLFAHQVIWNCHANHLDGDPLVASLEEIEKAVVAKMRPVELEYYEREFDFFRKVTGISGLLKPYIRREKWEKKKKIDEELKQIEVDPEARLYLPSNPESTVIGIDYESGRPLQSQAKAPFMATFRVLKSEAHEDQKTAEKVATWQSAIFKVGDDCRQDVLTLQLIALFRQIWEDARLDLFVFPYRVVATEPGCGVIEVIPNAISRDQLGRERINNIHLYFQQRHGPESSGSFAQARMNFVRSLAAYSLITFLVAVRDRHNGNIMVADAGHLIHIDFGFILDLCPGGFAFEKSPFKLTAEMIAVLGGQQSPFFLLFRRKLLKGFLAVRQHARTFRRLAGMMAEANFPCFAVPNNLENLIARFFLAQSDVELVATVEDLVYRSTENMRTIMYDSYQLQKNGIPY